MLREPRFPPRAARLRPRKTPRPARRPCAAGRRTPQAVPAPPISATRDAMIPASRSRRKHGLSQLTQNVCLNEKTTCAYSAATVDLPKPVGATRKRATSRERRRSAMRWGREWVAEEATCLGRRPLHEHDIRKSDIGVPLPKAKATVGDSTRRTDEPPYRMYERSLRNRGRLSALCPGKNPGT